MPPAPLLDEIESVCSLAVMVRLAIDADPPDPGLIRDRLRRLDRSMGVFRERLALWFLAEGWDEPPPDPSTH